MPASPGSRSAGHLVPLIQMSLPIVGDVLKHAGGSFLAEMVLIPSFKVCLERFPSLLVKIKTATGREFTVSADSVAPERVQQTIRDLNTHLGD